MNKKILFFCNCDINMKNGHGQMVRAHKKMLDILYPEQIITIMIREKVSDKEQENEYYLMHPTYKEKVIALLNGYTPELSLKSIKKIMKIIENNEIEYVVIECSMFGNLIKKIKSKFKNIKVITYFTDIEADLLYQEMKNCGIKRKLICQNLIKNERKTVLYSDKKFVLNNRDYNLYKKIYNKIPDEIIPLIISKRNIDNVNYAHKINTPLNLLFVGGDFWPNIVGIKWFIKNVLSYIKVSFELNIVGLYMEKYKKELEKDFGNINVIGTVDDIEPYLLNADVFIAPVKDGGGMKYKTAEALSYGKTFLGLEESLVGYWDVVPDELKNKGIYLCKDEKEFAYRINELFEIEYKKCRNDIKEFVDDLCGIDANIEKYKRLFK